MNLRRKSCGVQGDLFDDVFRDQIAVVQEPIKLTELRKRREIIMRLIKEWGEWDGNKYTSFDQSFREWISQYREFSFKDVDGIHHILKEIEDDILFYSRKALRELGKL